MKILGISAGYHDAAVTLIEDGNILFAGHSERYSCVKNDRNLNQALVDDVLTYGTPDQLAFYERPWLKKTRELYAGQVMDCFKNWTVRSAIKPYFKGIPVQSFSHHLSHAAGGFQTSPFKNATVIVIDAIGEWDTVSIWHAEYNDDGEAEYTKLWGQKYPHSIGLMYSAFTEAVGLKPNEEEYILMGMAAYGKADPSRNVFNNLIQEPLSEVIFKHNLHCGLPTEVTTSASLSFDLAAEAQSLFERLLITVISKAIDLGESGNIVYAGGSALNCLANRLLYNTIVGRLANIWIMPNPGDAGSSLGAAALAYKKKINWESPYLGHNIPGAYPVKALLTELKENHIVGVAAGRAEFGPRALGNRSLLADPCGSDIKDKVNEIKQRALFRPFSPVILEEHASSYFEMPRGVKSSPYMQVVMQCTKPHKYPAIIHKDGTSRVQTVPPNCKSGIRQLLEEWYSHTGCPMLLNTSLNIKGEPIVNTIEDARRFEDRYSVTVCTPTKD